MIRWIGTGYARSTKSDLRADRMFRTELSVDGMRLALAEAESCGITVAWSLEGDRVTFVWEDRDQTITYRIATRR